MMSPLTSVACFEEWPTLFQNFTILLMISLLCVLIANSTNFPPPSEIQSHCSRCIQFRPTSFQKYKSTNTNIETRQSKQCGFSIYIFDNSKSKSMVRLVRLEKMALSGLVFARKIARMILIQNI